MHALHSRVARVVALVVFVALGALSVGWLAPDRVTAAGMREQGSQPTASLRQAKYQLEVTVLSVEVKPGPHTGDSLWFRVRIERVMHDDSSSLKVGDETAVVSLTYRNAPGSLGTAGDRSCFRGTNGLPIKGDRARIYASGSPKILQCVHPNGWNAATPTLALVFGNASAESERTASVLAELVTTTGLATPLIAIAAANEFRAENLKENTDARNTPKTSITHEHYLRYADAFVLSMRDSTLAGTARNAATAPMLEGVNAFMLDAGTTAQPAPTAATAPTLQGRTRILPPDAAARAHPLLASLDIPAEGLVLNRALTDAGELGADCRVLLYAEVSRAGATTAPSRQPLLWVREVPRAPRLRPFDKASQPTAPLAPQRLAFTTLGCADDFATPPLRTLAQNAMAWVLEANARP